MLQVKFWSLLFVIAFCVPLTYFMPVLFALLRRAVVAMAEGQARAYTSGTHSVVFVTHDDMAKAKNLAGNIVKERMAACVNIVPKITSVYEWEGKINEDEELLMVIKTETAKVDALTKFVRENHSYDVPEVISMKIDNGNPAYLDWITDTVSSPTASPSSSQKQQ